MTDKQRGWKRSALYLGVLLLGLHVVHLTAAPATARAPAAAKHDLPDQHFRRASMAESSRSIAVALATNFHLAFDVHWLRTHTAWQGESLNMHGPPYTGQKSPFLSTFTGATLWTMPPCSPWSVGTLPSSTLPELPAGSKFRGFSTKSGQVTFIYDVATGRGKLTRVHEQPRREAVSESPAIVRRFEIGPSEEQLFLLLHAEMGRLATSANSGRTISIKREHDSLRAMARSDAVWSWETVEHGVSYPITLNVEKGLASDEVTHTVAGHQTRIYVAIAPHSKPIALEVASIAGPAATESLEAANSWIKAKVKSANLEFITSAEKDTSTPPPKIFNSDPSVSPQSSGDEFYRVEHFPVPREIALMVGGMDCLANGDLAVCTWPGDVYIVERPQGPPQAARYRRFARGLNEPLGLKVIRDRIFVVQKCELTRLEDTDNNGEADLYESISYDWGFSGNYHSFAFGPALDSAGNFHVLVAGQRGRWELPFLSWDLKISSDGSRTEGFCSGLRSPNGWGNFGPRQDLFVTDNQGEWIGACKLNHLQPGQSYGFPAASPAPKDDYGKPKLSQPPALWFPRKLAPSASGFVTIPDARFGPFQGQMLVGDFQNAVVLRVFLEEINGQWQGAVWPFAKGFYSGVNRLAFGPDGKLYVGGLKNSAWPALGPKEFSLDRVSFTGQLPFEIKEVHAKSDGFEMVFTQPVDPKSAENVSNYGVAQYTYKHHATYGSPEIDHDGAENSTTDLKINQAIVSADRLMVHLSLAGWRSGYVTRVVCSEVMNTAGKPLRHDTFYYTLNQIPK